MPETPSHIRDLVPDPQNPRRHTPRNIGMIAESLQQFGAVRGIAIDENNVILAGNGVVEAAAQAGIEHVRVYDRDTGQLSAPPPKDEPYILAVRVTGLTEEQKRQYAVVDNRTTDLSGWDTTVLSQMLDDGVDLSSFWFTEELEDLINTPIGDTGGDPEPPDDFASYDEDIDTEHQCPRCGYEWSGKPR